MAAEQRVADGDIVVAVVAAAAASAIETRNRNSRTAHFVPEVVAEVAAAWSIGGYTPGREVPARESVVDVGRQRQRPSTRHSQAGRAVVAGDQVVAEAAEVCKWAEERKDFCSWLILY